MYRSHARAEGTVPACVQDQNPQTGGRLLHHALDFVRRFRLVPEIYFVLPAEVQRQEIVSSFNLQSVTGK